MLQYTVFISFHFSRHGITASFVTVETEHIVLIALPTSHTVHPSNVLTVVVSSIANLVTSL